MKHLLKTILLIALVFVPALSHAEIFVTQTSTEVIGNTFISHYQATTPPPVDKNVYLWVGEYSKIPTNWISRTQKIQTLNASSTGYPKNFNAQMSFSSLGIVPGKKYAYTITDKTTGALSSAFIFDMNTAESLAVKCFTTTGTVPCVDANNQGGGGSNGAFDTSSFTVVPQEQQTDTENAGKYSTGFSITPKVPLVTSIPVTLKVFKYNGSTPTFLKEGNFPIPAGSGTTFPTVNNLDVGNYSAILYTGTTQISGEVGWQVVGPNQGSGGENIGNSVFDLVLNNVTPHDTSVDFDVSFGRKDGVATSGHLALYMGTADAQGVVSGYAKVSDPYTGSVGAVAPLNFSVGNLAPSTEYFYEFREIVTGLTFDVKSIKTLAAGTGQGGNPNGTNGNGFDFNGGAGAGATGVCGSANGTSTPALTVNSANLCSSGTSTEFNYDGANYSWKCKGSDGTTVSCSATGGVDTAYGSGFLKNPLAPGLDTFPKIFAAVYNNIILPIAVPFIVIAIMFAGFKFVIARKEGRVDGYAEAKRILKYTLIGTGLLLGGWVVANALQGTLNSLLGPESSKPAASVVIEQSIT